MVINIYNKSPGEVPVARSRATSIAILTIYLANPDRKMKMITIQEDAEDT